jgi:nucleoside-diphosphate-sugar epimerase
MNNLNAQLVYILGSGYCGSTLLNRLLNGHSQVIGLSEIFIVRHFSTSQWEKLFERSDLWQLVEKKISGKI